MDNVIRHASAAPLNTRTLEVSKSAPRTWSANGAKAGPHTVAKCAMAAHALGATNDRVGEMTPVIGAYIGGQTVVNYGQDNMDA
jgi:hypothetical protein